MTTRRLSRKEKGIFIACLLLIFIYAGYHFIFKPLQENTATVENQIELKEKRLRNNLRIVRKERIVDEEYDQYSSYLKQKASEEQEMAAILSQIESVANEVNIRIADMKPKKVKRVDFYNNFSVTLTIEGELKTIIRFLYTLQNIPHLFKIDEIYLERSSIRTTEIRCRLILSKPLISD